MFLMPRQGFESRTFRLQDSSAISCFIVLDFFVLHCFFAQTLNKNGAESGYQLSGEFGSKLFLSNFFS